MLPLSRIEELVREWRACLDVLDVAQLAGAADEDHADAARAVARREARRIGAAIADARPEGSNDAWHQLGILADGTLVRLTGLDRVKVRASLERAARIVIADRDAVEDAMPAFAPSASEEGGEGALMVSTWRLHPSRLCKRTRQAFAYAVLHLPDAVALQDRLRDAVRESEALARPV